MKLIKGEFLLLNINVIQIRTATPEF